MVKLNNLNNDESFGAKGCHPDIVCKTCKFAIGDPPFADAPTKAYCQIYERDDGVGKPSAVYYDGEDCKYYEQ